MSDAGYPHQGGGTLALRIRLFKQTEIVYPCLVYVNHWEIWLDINIRPYVSVSSADEVWWVIKSHQISKNKSNNQHIKQEHNILNQEQYK